MCNFLIMEESCGPLAVEIFPGNTEFSAPLLPRGREISLAHEQRCNFLIMEQCCGPLSVEIIQGKHCDFSTYLTKRARAQSGACAELKFPDYGTVLWSPGIEMVPGNNAISAPIRPRDPDLNQAHAQR
jgi:hypothetical protein